MGGLDKLRTVLYYVGGSQGELAKPGNVCQNVGSGACIAQKIRKEKVCWYHQN